MSGGVKVIEVVLWDGVGEVTDNSYCLVNDDEVERVVQELADAITNSPNNDLFTVNVHNAIMVNDAVEWIKT